MNPQLFPGPTGGWGRGKTRLGRLLCCNKEQPGPRREWEPWQRFEQDEVSKLLWCQSRKAGAGQDEGRCQKPGLHGPGREL